MAKDMAVANLIAMFNRVGPILLKILKKQLTAQQRSTQTNPPAGIPPISPISTPPNNKGGNGKNKEKDKEVGISSLIKLTAGFQLMSFISARFSKSMEVAAKAMAANIDPQKAREFQLPGREGSKGLLSTVTQEEEMLKLREEGIVPLRKSTSKLIERMTLTGQGTGSLIKMMGSNSSNLLLSTNQSELLVESISQLAIKYGVQQDALFKFSTSIANSMKVPALLGFGKSLTEAFTSLRAQMGGKSEENLDMLSKFLLDSNNFYHRQSLGLNGFLNIIKSSSSSSEQKTQAIKDIIRIMSSKNQELLDVVKSNGSNEEFNMQAFEMLANTVGGSQILGVVESLNKSMGESLENDSVQLNLEKSMLVFYEGMKQAIDSVVLFVVKLSTFTGISVKKLGLIVGGLAVLTAIIAAWSAIYTLGATAVVGALVTTGVVLAGGFSLMGEEVEDMSDKNAKGLKGIKDKLPDSNENRSIDFSKTLLNSLNQTLYNIVSNKDPRDRHLEIQEKHLIELQHLNKSIKGNGLPNTSNQAR
jgi:hypothetical protein